MTTARDYLRKYPSARPQTIAYLIKQDAIHQELRQGLKRSLFQKLRTTLHAALGRR